MGKTRIILYNFTIIVLILGLVFLNSNNRETKPQASTRQLSELPPNYEYVGYYLNSSSPFSNGAFHLLKYGAIGNSLIPFKNFDNLSQFAMIIIPFKEIWTQTEIDEISTYTNNGGIALITAYIPPALFNVTTANYDEFWIVATQTLAQSIGDRYHILDEISYYKALICVGCDYFPFDVIRNLSYITNVYEDNFTILELASIDSAATQVLGYTVVSKQIGQGSLVYSTVPIFDLLGQCALGGPVVPSSAQTGTWTGRFGAMVNRLIAQLFFINEKLVPLRWHTPFGKIALINSRDDVDSYFAGAVSDRGSVDRAHGVPTIFYELRDDIPESDWDQALDVSAEYPLGYHIPGYHRDSTVEVSAQSYLERILDIEAETGRPVYFECHHGGGGSGFFGQNYVRSAIEATNSLDHFVLYTSGEGGHANEYVEPFLYLLGNGTVVKAKNYYSLPKMTTIDSLVSSNSVIGFKDRITRSVFLGEHLRHAHWLLHSQNVRSVLTTSYDNLLTQIIDPIYEYLYADPIRFVELNLAYSENVSSSFKSNNTMLDVILDVKQSLEGYTFAIPFDKTLYLSDIKFDDISIGLDNVQVLHNGNSRYILFYLNLTQGVHNLVIRFQESCNQLPTDLDNDGVLDNAELSYFGTSNIYYDTDFDTASDGDEIFVFRSDPNDGGPPPSTFPTQTSYCITTISDDTSSAMSTYTSSLTSDSDDSTSTSTDSTSTSTDSTSNPSDSTSNPSDSTSDLDDSSSKMSSISSSTTDRQTSLTNFGIFTIGLLAISIVRLFRKRQKNI